MRATAKLKSAKISPIKVREVVGLVKGKSVDDALVILKYSSRKASFILKKIVDSAVANALDKGFDVDKLKVSNVVASDGVKMKRFQPKAMGRAGRILKRTSNIIVTLES